MLKCFQRKGIELQSKKGKDSTKQQGKKPTPKRISGEMDNDGRHPAKRENVKMTIWPLKIHTVRNLDTVVGDTQTVEGTIREVNGFMVTLRLL